MKNYLLLFCLILSLFVAKAQTVLISNDFTGYNGDPNTVASGWYYSWNDSSNIGVSFYSSAGSCGQSCSSYKFGLDSVTIITPSFSAADSVKFYLKGSGTAKPTNSFIVYESPDSINWNIVATINAIPLAAVTHSYALNPNTTNLKFFYNKDSVGLNLAFDDVVIFNNTPVGIEENKQGNFSISPNPVLNKLVIKGTMHAGKEIKVEVFDILGKKIFDHSSLADGQNLALPVNFMQGVYFVQITTEGKIYTRKILKL